MAERFCTLCDMSLRDPALGKEIMRHVERGTSGPHFVVWLEQREGRKMDPRTYVKHRKHSAHPDDRLIGVVKQREKQQGTARRKASVDELLDTLIDIGAERAERDPLSVSMKDVLKAAQIKTNVKANDKEIRVLLVAAMTERAIPAQVTEPALIEGSYTELEEAHATA